MSKSRQNRSWPPIYKRKYPSGQVKWQVAAMIAGNRVRRTFGTKGEAEVFAEQLHAERSSSGHDAFTMPVDLRVEATRCFEKLTPHGSTLSDAVDYYLEHVIAFRKSPPISEIVQRMIHDVKGAGRRERTVGDLQERLGRFVRSFGDRQLTSITLEELEHWLDDPTWSPRTRIHFMSKISQLYNYGIRHGWTHHNLIARLPRPATEDKEPGIFTADQACALLNNAGEYDLVPFIAIGFFAGLRTAELLRLSWSAVRMADRSIIIGSEIAKKRSRRVAEINETLVAWMEGCLRSTGPIVERRNLRRRVAALSKKAGIEKWPHNGLRHSFGSYHLAMYGDSIRTTAQMGHRSPDIVHAHYKALVLKKDSEKFWALRPEAA